MNDFKEYPYGRTLLFFEAYYPYDTEDVHYDEVMLSMSQCKTIDELITIRERLNEKIKKVGGSETFDKLPKDLKEELSQSSSIYSHQHWTITVKDNLRLDVNSCYDENVLRLLEKNESITANVCGECFINLSHCWELSPYKEKIIDVAKKKANIDVSELLETIVKRHEDFKEHWDCYKGFKEGMNGYNSAKKVVMDDFEYLKRFNWRLLPWEKSLYGEIDRDEIKKKEAFEKALKERREKREREEKEEEIRKREKEKNAETISTVLGVIIVIAIIVGLSIWMKSVEGGILLFIIICAVIKLYAGFFKN